MRFRVTESESVSTLRIVRDRAGKPMPVSPVFAPAHSAYRARSCSLGAFVEWTHHRPWLRRCSVYVGVGPETGSTSQATCVLVNNPYVTNTWPTRHRGDENGTMRFTIKNWYRNQSVRSHYLSMVTHPYMATCCCNRRNRRNRSAFSKLVETTFLRYF